MPFNESYVVSPYKVVTADLKRARNNEPMGMAGQSLIVFKNPHNIGLRLDDIRNDIIPVGACNQDSPVHINGIPFKEIYMTNSAEGGNVIFILLFTGSTTQLIDEMRKPKGFDKVLNKIGIKI